MNDVTRALIYGTIAAMIGTVVWAGIILFTGFQLGLVAWAIGGLIGYSVQMGTQGAYGVGPGSIAAGMTFLSILVAKGLAFTIAVAIGVPGLVLADFFGIMDLLFFALALFTAFQVGGAMNE